MLEKDSVTFSIDFASPIGVVVFVIVVPMALVPVVVLIPCVEAFNLSVACFAETPADSLPNFKSVLCAGVEIGAAAEPQWTIPEFLVDVVHIAGEEEASPTLCVSGKKAESVVRVHRIVEPRKPEYRNVFEVQPQPRTGHGFPCVID